jgi:hypothetical protein
MRGRRAWRVPSVLALLLALTQASQGCGPSTVIEVAPPLAVVDTFPANGANLRGAEVSHIDVVFSDLVDGAGAVAAIRLESVNSADEVVTRYDLAGDPARGDNGFDDRLLTLSLLIGAPSTDGTLPDNNAFRLTIGAGLAARSGSVLPVDLIHRFITAP